MIYVTINLKRLLIETYVQSNNRDSLTVVCLLSMCHLRQALDAKDSEQYLKGHFHNSGVIRGILGGFVMIIACF
jgi:hypothetical protein